MAIDIDRSSLDNSYATKEAKEREKLAAVVSKENVVVKKESLGKKMRKAFISDDMKDVGNYVFMDIVVPGVKNAVLDTLERIFFNSDSHRSRSRRYDDRDRVSYSSYYRSSDSARRDKRREAYDDRKGKIDYRNIVLTRREDAEKVIDILLDDMREYKNVTVAGFLERLGEDSSWTDNDYGWEDPRDFRIKRVRDGYLIDVPDAHYLGD